MRQERTVQSSVFDLFAGHEIGCELKAMSQWLDEHRELLSLVTRDLRRHDLKETGREGLPAEAVLRCALLSHRAAFRSTPASAGRYPMTPLPPDRPPAATSMPLYHHASPKHRFSRPKTTENSGKTAVYGRALA